MKIKLLLVTLACCFSVCILQAKGKDNALRYDVECAGQEGMTGTYLVMAWVYSSKANISTDIIKEAAIRGVLFRGYQGKGCTSQKAIIEDPAIESDKADFFHTFFGSGGPYLNYATALEDSFEVIKLSKKEYKVGMVVSVSKDNLRKAMEDAEIKKKLSSGF